MKEARTGTKISEILEMRLGFLKHRDPVVEAEKHLLLSESELLSFRGWSREQLTEAIEKGDVTVLGVKIGSSTTSYYLHPDYTVVERSEDTQLPNGVEFI